MDNIGVIQGCNGLSLLDELSLELTHNFGIALREEQEGTGIFITLIVVLREELLDTYITFSHHLFGKVGDAKATMTKGLQNAIFTSLKQCISLQLHSLGFSFCNTKIET